MSNNNIHNDPQDQDLLQRVSVGDELAFADLVQRFTPIIYRYLLYWLKLVPVVEEAAQDIFMRVWRNREKLDGMENFSGYLFVIARNHARNVLAEQAMSGRLPLTPKLDNLLITPQHSLELKELAGLLNDAIELLPPRRKEIFKLNRQGALTYEEIAAKLGISRNTVKEHMVAALLFLRHYIQSHSDIVITALIGFLLMGA